MILNFFAKSKNTTTQPDAIHENHKFLEINFRYPGIIHSGQNKYLITSPDEIVKSYDEFIHKNKLSSGLRSDVFNNMVMPAIKNYANFVHIVPATFSDCYSAPGGLFKFGLDVAFSSLEFATDKINSLSKESQDDDYGQKLLLATFLGGLFSHLYLAITNMSVLSADEKKWPSSRIQLYSWLQIIDSQDFKVIWNQSGSALKYPNYDSIKFVLDIIIPTCCINYFQDDRDQLLNCISSTLFRINYSGNLIEESVRAAEVYIIQKDIDYQTGK